MKKILCFGDSNTYGFNPNDGSRFPKNVRWTGILSEHSEFSITEAGFNNRTAFILNPAGKELTGCIILPEYLKKDIYDVVILSIGINDLQKFFNPKLDEFKAGIENLVKMTKDILPDTEILLICPSKLNKEAVLKGYFSFQFDETSVKKSFKLPKIYQNIASEYNCKFLDLNKVTEVSKTDGLHFTPEGHQKIAAAVMKKLL